MWPTSAMCPCSSSSSLWQWWPGMRAARQTAISQHGRQQYAGATTCTHHTIRERVCVAAGAHAPADIEPRCNLPCVPLQTMTPQDFGCGCHLRLLEQQAKTLPPLPPPPPQPPPQMTLPASPGLPSLAAHHLGQHPPAQPPAARHHRHHPPARAPAAPPPSPARPSQLAAICTCTSPPVLAHPPAGQQPASCAPPGSQGPVFCGGTLPSSWLPCCPAWTGCLWALL